MEYGGAEAGGSVDQGRYLTDQPSTDHIQVLFGSFLHILFGNVGFLKNPLRQAPEETVTCKQGKAQIAVSFKFCADTVEIAWWTVWKVADPIPRHFFCDKKDDPVQRLLYFLVCK